MRTLTTNELKELRTNNPELTILNVLDPEYYKKAHIEGTENIPLNTDGFVDKVESRVPSKESPVVVYCANESCDMSPKAARKLEAAGFTEIYDFEGGTEAWKDAGLPLAGAAA